MDLSQRISRITFPTISALTFYDIQTENIEPSTPVQRTGEEFPACERRLKEKLAKCKKNVLIRHKLAEVQTDGVLNKSSAEQALDALPHVTQILDSWLSMLPKNPTPEEAAQLEKRTAERLLETIFQDALDLVESTYIPLLDSKVKFQLKAAKKKPRMTIRGLYRRKWNAYLFSKSFQVWRPKHGVLKFPGLWKLYRCTWLEVFTHGCRTERIVPKRCDDWTRRVKRIRRIERRILSPSLRRGVQSQAKLYVYSRLWELSGLAAAVATLPRSPLWRLLGFQFGILPYLISRAHWDESGAFGAFLEVVQAYYSGDAKEKRRKWERRRDGKLYDELKAAAEKSDELAAAPLIPMARIRRLTKAVEEMEFERARFEKEKQGLEHVVTVARGNLEYLIKKREMSFDKMWREYLEKPGNFRFTLSTAELVKWSEMREKFEKKEESSRGAGGTKKK